MHDYDSALTPQDYDTLVLMVYLKEPCHVNESTFRMSM